MSYDYMGDRSLSYAAFSSQLGIDRLSSGKNVLAANPARASFKSAFTNEIDFVL
jgi:hypothetical protein